MGQSGIVNPGKQAALVQDLERKQVQHRTQHRTQHRKLKR